MLGTRTLERLTTTTNDDDASISHGEDKEKTGRRFALSTLGFWFIVFGIVATMRNADPDATLESTSVMALRTVVMTQDIMDTRAEAFRCFDKLFQTTKQQFEENANWTLPVLNSARYTKDDREIQLFFALGRHTNMKDKLHLQFKNGDFFCDNDSTKARVIRHTSKVINQIKMYCPRNTSKVYFGTQDQALKSYLTFDLEPFLECDRKQQALLPLDMRGAKIAACTQVKYAPSYHLLPQWIEYHRMIGVDSLWVYINDKMSTYEREAPDVVDYFNRRDVQQYASVLPAEWTDNVEAFFTQRAIYNDCMENALRNNITWVLLSDADEFVNVINATKSLKDLVQPYHDRSDVAALLFRNTFYGFKDTKTDLDYSKPPLLLRDSVYRTEPSAPGVRSKLLVRPELIRYMLVHKVGAAEGGVVNLDPFREARLNHYKKACTRPTRDTHLADAFTSPLEERLAKVYHPTNPARFYPNEIDEHCVGD